MQFPHKMPLYFFYTMVQKSKKRPKLKSDKALTDTSKFVFGLAKNKLAGVCECFVRVFSQRDAFQKLKSSGSCLLTFTLIELQATNQKRNAWKLADISEL